MKALNANELLTGDSFAHDLKNLGVQAVGCYLRGDRITKDIVDRLHSVGIKMFSVFERGYPDHVGYFSQQQATIDAGRALAIAEAIGQPEGSSIAAAYDYDATATDISGPLYAYQVKFRQIVKDHGYLAACYGSGLLCRRFVEGGIAHWEWLSGSHGWAGYDDYKDHAAVLQGANATVLGCDVDWDEVRDPAILW